MCDVEGELAAQTLAQGATAGFTPGKGSAP